VLVLQVSLFGNSIAHSTGGRLEARCLLCSAEWAGFQAGGSVLGAPVAHPYSTSAHGLLLYCTGSLQADAHLASPSRHNEGMADSWPRMESCCVWPAQAPATHGQHHQSDVDSG
jgi:hypothetical protein